MTDRSPAFVCEPIDLSETSRLVMSVSPRPAPVAGNNLLDDSWAEEFDRRLAAWQAESEPAEIDQKPTLEQA